MDFGAFLRYWALTLAVFVFYIFAFAVAGLDTLREFSEAARKRRAERQPAALDPNPLASRSVAQTIFPGPGQIIEGRREWVARAAEEVVRGVNPQPPVRTLVLEDSKGHPLVHFSNGARVATYRFARASVDAAIAGDALRVSEITDTLKRHLAADFLGREDVRPPRTTELARDSAAKPSTAPAAKVGTPAPVAVEAGPPVPLSAPAPAASAPGAPPSGPAGDVESMSREERLAAARAKAEALRAARQSNKPQ